jgi:transcriptional regulator with XRE-family HTH domain
MSTDFLMKLGAGLKAERKKAGLTQTAVGLALGLKPPGGHAYVSCLETGKMGNVGIETIMRYLQICKTPIGRFMLELAQSGAFGEAEAESVRGFVTQKPRDEASSEQARREKARARDEKRVAREAQDAVIVSRLWVEVQSAIRPLLPPGQMHLFSSYLKGVKEFYRVWKLALREARGVDPTPLVLSAFDRVERTGIGRRLVPAAVRMMREVIFERLRETAEQN